MYLGSRTPHTQEIISYENHKPLLKERTWTPAAFTAFREVLDNALDEMLGHGFGNRLDVDYDETTKIITIKDNGRGIPTDWDEQEEMHKATLVMSHARAGRNFGDREEVAGTNGIGASVVNFCSEFFELKILHNGEQFEQKFIEGEDELQIDAPKIKAVKSQDTGTQIRFKLSEKVFGDYILPLEFIEDRIFEVALFNPALSVYFNKQRIKINPVVEKNIFDKEKIMKFVIDEEGFKSTFYVKPNFTKSGDYHFSFVNNIPAYNGGSHIDVFRRQFINNTLEFLAREGKKRKLTPNRSDVTEGLLILNHTRMKAPNFDSQSKTRLINEQPGKIINSFMTPLEVNKVLKKNHEWIEEIFERCAERTNKKDASELEKLAKKTAKKKIPKLIEANSNKRDECVLFLTEGDSAIASLVSVRDPKIHAGLPLRGKVMNVHGQEIKKTLSSQILVDIMNSIGLTIGKKATRDGLRYGKLFVAHDEDTDGYNIGALVVNFLYTYWPELFAEDDPFVYIFKTPFIILEKGKTREYFYGDNIADYDPEKYKGWSTTRAKGLGSLELVDWEHSLKNPKLFAIVDDGKLSETLDLIFNGARADARKEWMSI